MLRTCLLLGLMLCWATPSAAAAPASADHVLPPEQIQRFVADFLKGASGESAVALAYADLSEESPPQVLLYFSGQHWCGSGGCTLVVLRQGRDHLEEVARTTVTRLPITVLAGRSHGWHDLAVGVGGGGVPGGQAVLRFDGARYPGNPSQAPAIPLHDPHLLEGEILIRKQASPGPLAAATIQAAEEDYRQDAMEREAAAQCDADQASLNLCSYHRFKQADARLNLLYDWLHQRAGDPATARRLQEAQRAWLHFVEADCLYRVGPRDDSGTIWPLLQNNCRADHTEQRVQQFRQLLACEQDDCPGH